MKILPYLATTGTGDAFDIEFPLHPDTGHAVRISQLISDILLSIDRNLASGGATSNGDVLQAVAMAMAIRTRTIHAPIEVSGRLAMELLAAALTAAGTASRQAPTTGHA